MLSKILNRIYFILLQNQREILLSKIKKGKDIFIMEGVRIQAPRNLELGSNVTIMDNTVLLCGGNIIIDDDVMISANCSISSTTHPVEIGKRAEMIKSAVHIKRNAWIGMGTCILPGVTIGENSVIGAGSIVNKNVPKNEIWVGSPAKFLKKIDLQ
jgi:galactoside O-acetyltransferase